MGEFYVGVKIRRAIARAAQDVLLVSIHADAFNDPRANGSSVYALSLSGATSASAKFLAERENRSDLVGGVKISDKDDMLAEMLTDLSMTASLDASLGMGSMVLTEMAKISRLHKRKVEQAGFAVLKSPDVPSILVETGFISNPREARYLQQKGYQRDMAKAVFAGIDKHFRSSPPPDTWFAALKRGDAKDSPGKVTVSVATKTHEHKVSSGDTLYGLARQYKVSVKEIRSANNLKSDTLKVGQVISIPLNQS
jgi:N-acetylmuramoyl-L-alanine amidase